MLDAAEKVILVVLLSALVSMIYDATAQGDAEIPQPAEEAGGEEGGDGVKGDDGESKGAEEEGGEEGESESGSGSGDEEPENRTTGLYYKKLDENSTIPEQIINQLAVILDYFPFLVVARY